MSSRRYLVGIASLLLMAGLGAGVAAAQAPPPTSAAPPVAEAPVTPQPAPPPALDDVMKPVAAVSAAIDAAEKAVDSVRERDSELANQRAEIEGIRSDAERAASALRPRLKDVQSQIDKLGPKPAEGAPPESEEIAAERARLDGLAAQIGGAIKTAELVDVRARQLISRVQELRQGLFTRFLFRRTESPLKPGLWARVADELPGAGRQIAAVAANWWSVASLRLPGLLSVLALALGTYVGLKLLVRRLIRARLDVQGPAEPTFLERAAAAGWVAPALALPAAAAAVLLFAGLDSQDLLYWQTELIAGGALFVTLLVIAVSALARAILQPRRAHWRLIDVSDPAARRLSFAVHAIVVVYAVDYLVRRIVHSLVLPLPLSVAAALVSSLLFAALVFVIVRTRFEPRVAGGEPVSRWQPHWLKLPLATVAIAIVGASLLGYVALGRFIAGQVVLTGSAVVLIALLHLAIGALAEEQTGRQKAVGRVLEGQLGLDEPHRRQVARAFTILLNVVLAVIAVPLVLLAWGSSPIEILAWLKAAIFGFEIGQFRISFARLLFAVALFLGLLFLTRLLQRWLSSSVLQSARIDHGIANSIYTGVGYAGFAIAVLVAISYGGLDITNLAIVAGALSVGIGFGLQSIVNNFVSGLILLIERPVKVGDLVNIKGQEGYVRRIAVRSTEIETPDRASVIVPNSELITSSVTNWTHRNALSRIVIRVGAAYTSDPEQVGNLLQKVASECPSILQQPAPAVGFDNFGPTALEFSLSAVVPHVSRALAAQTDLRARILKAFREAGLEIPHAPQEGSLGGVGAAERAVVRVSVAQTCDPEQVQAVLHRVAARTPHVLDEPAPTVIFEALGASAFEFSVTASVAHGRAANAVETALRTGIVKAFRDAGIELAHPQHDVHLRDLDVVRALLSRLSEDRTRQAGEGTGEGRQSAPGSAAPFSVARREPGSRRKTE